jgi:hypothetical protein
LFDKKILFPLHALNPTWMYPGPFSDMILNSIKHRGSCSE